MAASCTGRVVPASRQRCRLWPMVGAYDTEHYVIRIGMEGNTKTELVNSHGSIETIALSVVPRNFEFPWLYAILTLQS